METNTAIQHAVNGLQEEIKRLRGARERLNEQLETAVEAEVALKAILEGNGTVHPGALTPVPDADTPKPYRGAFTKALLNILRWAGSPLSQEEVVMRLRKNYPLISDGLGRYLLPTVAVTLRTNRAVQKVGNRYALQPHSS